MPKWKNILQDIGSAVVPAATTLGFTALAGPAGAAFALPSLVAATGAGARGFARNEEEERLRKMMRLQAEEDRQAQAMANLINALQPGSGARARPSEIAMPKKGFGETIAGGVGQGIQAYQLAKSAQEALAKRTREKALEEAAIDEAKRKAEQAEGAAQAAMDLYREREKAKRLEAQIIPTEGVRKEVLQTIEQSNAAPTGQFSPRLRRDVPTTIGGGDALAHKRAQAEALRTRPFPGVDRDLRQFTTPQSPEATLGYMGVMGEHEKQRFAQTMDLDRLALSRESARATTEYQERVLKAQSQGDKDARAYKEARDRDEHRIRSIEYVAKTSGVERLDKFRKDHLALKKLFKNINDNFDKNSEYHISGTDQIALLNLFHRTIDPATVREGDVALYRSQAQGFFDKLQTDIGRIKDNESGVISDKLLRDMEDSLEILNDGYMQNAAIEIGSYYDGQTQVGYEFIPESLIENLRIASFTTHGVDDPRVADRTELISLIEDARNRVSSVELQEQRTGQAPVYDLENIPGNIQLIPRQPFLGQFAPASARGMSIGVSENPAERRMRENALRLDALREDARRRREGG